MVYAKAANGPKTFKEKLQFRFKKSNRTFILPTSFGYAFAAMAFVLLFMAIGYANNLIYLYVFSLISVGLTSMYITNRNVERLEILEVNVMDLFAKEENPVAVSIFNQSQGDSFQLELRLGKNGSRSQIKSVLKQKRSIVRVAYVPKARGMEALPKMTLSSSFPFGILEAWKVKKMNDDVLVYPERKGDPSFPQLAQADQSQGQLGLFRDHRAFQSSDSPRRVDWRATAKYQSLLVKNFEGGDRPALKFSWEQTVHLEDFEARVSQLALWVSLAEQMGHAYALSLKNFTIEESQGEVHFKKCMEKLALLTHEDVE